MDADEKFEEIYQAYRKYMLENSKYSPEITKKNLETASKFPTVTFTMSNNTATDNCTIDYIEQYEEFYFTINIYTKDKTVDNKVVASQIINNELSKLTNEYLGQKLHMKKTLNSPTPNLDTSILRRTMRYQCMIGSAMGDIIRR